MTDPVADAEAAVQRIWARTTARISDADAALLAACPDRTLMMDKLLLMHATQSGDLEAALAPAERVFADEPGAESAQNLALLLHQLGRSDDCSAFAEANRSSFAESIWYDLMAMVHSDIGAADKAAAFGTGALRAKDAACAEAPVLAPVTRPFDIEAPTRNIIAFSLWGQDPRYLMGAVNNAVVARYLYPGWTCRFYLDDSVPGATVDQLRRQGAQIARVGGDWTADRFGLFWRFLVEDDANVDLYLVRDADSVMNIKERAAVEDWLASGRAFHVMRDLPRHSELILAGMWGAHRGNIGGMAARIRAHVDAPGKSLGNVTTDQLFLRREVWPIVRQDVLMHDAAMDLPGTTRFREEFALPRTLHIGQNDWKHVRREKAAG